MEEQYVSEKDVYGQMQKLKVKPVSRLTLGDWARRELIPRPRGGGGRSQRREYHPATVPELYAGMALLLVGSGTVSKAQIRFVRQIALTIESLRSPHDVLAVARGFSRGAGGSDISKIGQDVVHWLRCKRQAFRELYGNQSDFEKRRDHYFESPHFVRLMWGLTNNFYDGYRFEGNRLIAPEKKMSVEFEALRNFPTAA